MTEPEITLKEYFERVINDLKAHQKEISMQQEKRLNDVAVATDKAVSAALSAAEKAVNTALASADKASMLLAENTKEKMEYHNGLLAKMSHYEAMFASITAVEDLKKALADLRLMVEKREAFWPAVAALITGLVALALGLMQFVK